MKKEDLTKFYQTYKLYIFPTVVAVSSLFLILFVVFPTMSKLISGQKTSQDLITKSNFLETKVLALESLDSEDLSRKVGFALSVLPAEKDFGDILGLLQSLAGQTGFSISSISLGASGSKLTNTESYEVKMEIKGTRVLLPALINNIENSPRLMKIKKIDVSSGQSSQVIGVSLVVDVLYSGLPQTFGTADAPLPQLSEQDEQFLANMAQVGGETPAPSSTITAPRGKPNPFE